MSVNPHSLDSIAAASMVHLPPEAWAVAGEVDGWRSVRVVVSGATPDEIAYARERVSESLPAWLLLDLRPAGCADQLDAVRGAKS